jgi:hypothetical protein
MIEMSRTYSKGFLENENVTIEKLAPWLFQNLTTPPDPTKRFACDLPF